MTAAPITMIELPTDSTPVTAAAEMYAQLGLTPIPLYGVVDGKCTCSSGCEPRSAGKHPVGNGWERRASSDVDRVREAFRSHRGNIGLLMGSTHVAIDADGPTGLESLRSLGELPETLTARTGSGGEHRIFRFAPHHDPARVTNRTFLPKLDAKTRNGQIVAAPSVHRSGTPYRWVVAVPPAVLPDSVYEVMTRRPDAPAPLAPAPAPPAGGDLLRRARAYLATIPPAVSGAGGHTQAFAAARALVGWVRRGLSEADALHLLREYNGRCVPPWSARDLDHKWQEAQRATDIPDIVDRPPPAVVRPIRPDVAIPSASTAVEWSDRLIMETRSGVQRPAKHAENAIVVVRYHPAWQGRIKLDLHSSTITVHEAPWHDSDRPAEEPPARPWTDADSVRLSAWIRRELGVDLSVEACDRAVGVAAESCTYHPVRDWMSSLTWDGVPRLATAAERLLGAHPAPDYHPLVWWLIAAVARTFEPGCKVDNVLILEGPQGLRKSSALRTLASAAWFSDTPLDLHSKDAIVALQGRLIVELAELDSLRRADASRAKSFFSSCVDDYRPPYGRRSVKAPRQCVFAGTVNHGSYLQDPTGNRRYWPVACTRVDLEAIAAERSMLWAEAVHLYHEGRPWWPSTPAEVAACEAAQEPRAEGDEWEGLLASWLRRHPDARPTVGELLVDVLDIPKDRWTRSDQMRVASSLQRLGFARRQVRDGTDRVWRYHPLGT